MVLRCRVPVTVVRPQKVLTAAEGGNAIARLGKQTYSPGSESRRFIAVPEGATWAELRTFAGDHPTPRVSSIRIGRIDFSRPDTVNSASTVPCT